MHKLTVHSGEPLASAPASNMYKPRFEHVTLRATAFEALKVTVFRWEGLPVESPNWVVYDLRVNGQSWFKVPVERGLPADLLALSTAGRFIKFGYLAAGDVLEIDVANLWSTPKTFTGALVSLP